MRTEKLKLIEDCQRVYQQVLENGDCVSLKTLAVGGRDLIEMGVEPGKKLGEILDKMLKDVLDEPGHNTREYLLDPDRLKKRFMK
jgi:tRNA nucleotidyltransferase (CCA-adding enzyme)